MKVYIISCVTLVGAASPFGGIASSSFHCARGYRKDCMDNNYQHSSVCIFGYFIYIYTFLGSEIGFPPPPGKFGSLSSSYDGVALLNLIDS